MQRDQSHVNPSDQVLKVLTPANFKNKINQILKRETFGTAKLFEIIFVKDFAKLKFYETEMLKKSLSKQSWIKIYILQEEDFLIFFPDFLLCRFCFLDPGEKQFNKSLFEAEVFLWFSSLPVGPRHQVDKFLCLMASGQIAESHQNNYSFHTWTVIGDNWFFSGWIVLS